MPGKQLYEYAVIRVVPRVEREEFINVGVLLYCRGLRFLGILSEVGEARLKAFSPTLDTGTVAHYLESMDRICCGGAAGGPIGALDVASRFRWLTATRSTMVQTSKVHAGFCIDPQEMLTALFTRLVAPSEIS